MKFAILENTKIEATKGAKGNCPCCGAELIAKCGEVKIHHWSHKGVRSCDPWWENETKWHRAWKNNFPLNTQEIILFDSQSGEKHIADVRTVHELTIEFQHSHIKPEERRSRENFYKKMVWIVDGTRLQSDYPRFLKAQANFRISKTKGTYHVNFPDECFPKSWLGSSVPVIFDFQGVEFIDNHRNNLYCLFPDQVGDSAVLTIISRQSFIDSLLNDNWTKWVTNYTESIKQADKNLKFQLEQQQRQINNLAFQRLTRTLPYPKRRRRF